MIHIFLILSAVAMIDLHSGGAFAGDELVHKLAAPVYEDPADITLFFTQQFQHRAYARQVLPATLDHLAQLLEFAPHAQDPLVYATTVIQIFTQRLRATTWIDPLTVLTCLQRVRPVLTRIAAYDDVQELEARIHHALERRLITYIRSCTTDLEPVETPYLRMLSTIDDELILLTKELGSIARGACRNDQVQDLLYAWAQCMDVAISRFVWSPAHQIDSWRSTCAIADELFSWWDDGLLPNSARLNDLYWALLCRYGYFLELMYQDISPELFVDLNRFLVYSDKTWLAFPEQDPLMLTKQTYLYELLLELAVQKELEQPPMAAQAPQLENASDLRDY